jgi:hypothetical protein
MAFTWASTAAAADWWRRVKDCSAARESDPAWRTVSSARRSLALARARVVAATDGGNGLQQALVKPALCHRLCPQGRLGGGEIPMFLSGVTLNLSVEAAVGGLGCR